MLAPLILEFTIICQNGTTAKIAIIVAGIVLYNNLAHVLKYFGVDFLQWIFTKIQLLQFVQIPKSV